MADDSNPHPPKKQKKTETKSKSSTRFGLDLLLSMDGIDAEDLREKLLGWYNRIIVEGHLLPIKSLTREQQLKGCWIHRKSSEVKSRLSKKITLFKGFTGELRWGVGIAFLSNSENSLVDPSYQGSHLCHEKFCVRLDHLILESQEANLNRNPCPGTILAHKSKTDMTIVSACKHDPPCLNLSIAESYSQWQMGHKPASVPLMKLDPLSKDVQNLLPFANRQVTEKELLALVCKK